MSAAKRSAKNVKPWRSIEEMKREHWEVDCEAFQFMCPVCNKIFKKQQHNCIKTLVDERKNNLEDLRINYVEKKELEDMDKRGNINN